MDDIDTHYDQMLAAYQKQLKAIEQYLGMKKILNKKVTHEMRASELEESKAFDDGGREGYYGRPNRNPYEPGTQEHKDYNRGYEQFKGDKDWDVPKRPVREGNTLPEDTKSEFKSAALAKIKKLLDNPKLDPSTRKDYELRLHKIQALEEGGVVSINRGGHNAFRDKADFLDKRDYVQRQLLDPRQRDNYAELKQRLQDINYAGRKLGYIK